MSDTFGCAICHRALRPEDADERGWCCVCRALPPDENGDPPQFVGEATT